MTQNCLLEKLSISVNKLNNQVLENLLKKNSLSLTHLNIGEIMHNNGMSDDFFQLLVKKNLRFFNLYSLSISLIQWIFDISHRRINITDSIYQCFEFKNLQSSYLIFNRTYNKIIQEFLFETPKYIQQVGKACFYRLRLF